MKTCHHCGKHELSAVALPDSLQVGAVTFTTSLPSEKCDTCGETTTSGAELALFESQVLEGLIGRQIVTGPALLYFRKQLPMTARALAAYLGVAHETLSRWENGAQPIPLHVWKFVADIALRVSRGAPLESVLLVTSAATLADGPVEIRLSA